MLHPVKTAYKLTSRAVGGRQELGAPAGPVQDGGAGRGWGLAKKSPRGCCMGPGRGGLPVVFLGEVHLLSRELPGEGLAPAKWPFLASSFESGHP